MTEERTTCFGYPRVWEGETEIARLYGCSKPAKYEVDGKPFCGIHRPIAERATRIVAARSLRIEREAVQRALDLDIYRFVRDVANEDYGLSECEKLARELVKRMDAAE